jgi:cyclophilin family peptidyl-prolyl cis-trans isomerase
MALLSAVVALVAVQGYHPSGPKIEVELSGHRTFIITTDPKGSPLTTKGILRLVKGGFYDGQRVHRVESWVVQWGDPQSKTLSAGDSRLGTQGSGHPLPFEDGGANFTRGIVGIASTGTGVGGDSQLFVLTKDAVYLNHGYAVLGKVTEGMKVVAAISVGIMGWSC